MERRVRRRAHPQGYHPARHDTGVLVTYTSPLRTPRHVLPVVIASALLLGSTVVASAGAAARSAGSRTGTTAEVARGAAVTAHAKPYPANVEYDPGGYGTFNQAALTNPDIDAVDVNLNWYVVEPQPGVFNFGPADQEVAAWAKQGKQVTFELRFQHESNVPAPSCTGDGWLPPWVATTVPLLCERADPGGLVIPDYFDPTFEADWRTYVAAVASHFANGPYHGDVAYARVALGLGAESFPLEPCYDPAAHKCDAAAYAAAVRTLRAWGYTATSWLRWQERLLSYYRREFAYTTVIYPINQMLYPASSRLNVNPATGDPIEEDVAEWAAAHGMGIGQQGLDGAYAHDYARFNEIAAYVHKHDPTTYVQFQTVSEVSNKSTASCSAACLFEEDVLAAEHYHARSVEWYAADDTNAAFQPYLAEWQRYVDK